ncbi:MAG: lytic murein transglycosylase [Candidatus Harrisonbacteria bacterium]|nr:lytic murein transglycosylase [Candidatus Harrisonbacteria bacterium]
MRPKPKVLRDLYSIGSRGRLLNLNKIVNLNQNRILRLPFITISKALVIFGVFSYLVFGSALAPVSQNQLSLAAQSDEERQQLEKQLEELEKQIDEYQATVDKYKTQGKSLQSEINRLNAQINKLTLQIKAVNLSLQKLDKEITVNKSQILTTEQKIEQNKAVLTRSLQNIYENESISMAEILLRQPRLSDFFANVNDLINIQESLRVTLEKVVRLREDLLDKKETLAIKKNDTEQLKAYQDSQRAALNSVKGDKAEVLKTTKGNEQKYQALLKETQKTAAQIRSRIFEFLGGGELTFEEAYEFAKFAEQATGVRAALTLAVLDKESALGQNVGRCTYQKAMHPTRDVPIFLALISELGIKPETVTVSCPNRDGLYGGAMGPAQFIPSTWKLYSPKIAEVTGSNPPSPWRNSDAFMGTALYLKDSGAANASLANERIAAARYYAGGRWRTYLWTYGDRVVTQAERFQKDIDILNS